MGFAENVKSELEFQDIQIKELAKRTGISKNTLDKYLSGKKAQPGVENAVKIAKALGVSVEYLVRNSEKETFPSIQLTESEILILKQFNSLNSFTKQTVLDLLSSLSKKRD